MHGREPCNVSVFVFFFPLSLLLLSPPTLLFGTICAAAPDARVHAGRLQRNESRARLAVWQDLDGRRRAVHLARVNNYDGQQGKQQGELASN